MGVVGKNDAEFVMRSAPRRFRQETASTARRRPVASSSASSGQSPASTSMSIVDGRTLHAIAGSLCPQA